VLPECRFHSFILSNFYLFSSAITIYQSFSRHYIGVNAALGLSISANAKPFNQDDIEEVVFLGYSEEKSESFRIRLGRALAQSKG